MRTLLRWLLNAIAMMLVPVLITSIHVHSLVAGLIAAAIIGLLNVLVRPLLVLLTLPITALTMGLFLLIINGVLFWLAAAVVPGFEVPGLWAAVGGALVYSVLTWLVDRAIGDPQRTSH